MNQKDCSQKHKIKIEDIIADIRSYDQYRYVSNNKKAKKIIKQYFKMAINSALEGYEFDILRSSESKSNIGSLVIHKRRLKQGEMPKKSFVTKDYSYNRFTVGYKYTIDMISDFLDENGMYFKAAPAFRNKLSKILFSNKRDYRYVN